MNTKHTSLAQLRSRAEALLKTAVDAPTTATQTIDEVVHELNVYHVELQIQLEDLHQSYHALEIVQQRYANLFEFAPVGYIVIDMQGAVTNANLTASTILSVERKTLENIPFADFITPEFQDTYHLCRRTVPKTGLSQACEVQLRRVGGDPFYAQLNIDLPDGHSETLRISITNISTIKQTEEALQRALAREREINQVRARVLSVIEHEFRTPLAVILSSVAH